MVGVSPLIVSGSVDAYRRLHKKWSRVDEIIVARELSALAGTKNHDGRAVIVGEGVLTIGGDYLSVRIYKLTTRKGLLTLETLPPASYFAPLAASPH